MLPGTIMFQGGRLFTVGSSATLLHKFQLNYAWTVLERLTFVRIYGIQPLTYTKRKFNASYIDYSKIPRPTKIPHIIWYTNPTITLQHFRNGRATIRPLFPTNVLTFGPQNFRPVGFFNDLWKCPAFWLFVISKNVAHINDNKIQIKNISTTF